jgi:integrase
MKIEKVFRKDLNAWRWKIDLTISGKRIRRADFETKREAIEAIAALQTKVRANRYGLITKRPVITLENLYDKISKDKKSNQRALNIFQEFVSHAGPDSQLVNLSKASWQKYIQACKNRNLRSASINRYLAVISGILRSAVNHFPELETWSSPSVPWESNIFGRDRILAVKEISALLKALQTGRQPHEQDRSLRWRRELFDLFRLMLLTAAREGEILHLKQSQISWDWKVVTIHSLKGNGSRRVVPLSNTALEILQARQKYSPRVFPVIEKTSMYNALARTGVISKVAYGEKIENGWILYDLRHLAATILENSGCPYSAVSEILGHKRKDQTATYTHALQSTMRVGIESLETWCREIDGFFMESTDMQDHLRLAK